MITIHMLVHGRVQGVGFRFFVQTTAMQLNITGWVQNTPSGSVELIAQGEDENIDKFISKVSRGPKFSNVTDVDLKTLSSNEEYTSFKTLY